MPSRLFGRSLQRLLTIGLLVFSAACTPEGTLMPTPAIYTGPSARLLFSKPRPTNGVSQLNLLYATDRLPAKKDGHLSYESERSHVMTFGTVTVNIENPAEVREASLAPPPSGSNKNGKIDIGEVRELVSFPRTPYTIEKYKGAIRRAPDVVNAHEKAIAQLQAEVSRRLAKTTRKEIVFFIHGYNNSFEDAATTTGNLCHFLGEEFLCVVLSWPAGGSSGILFGYNVDRESGEFAVTDLKKAIRAIAETPGVRHTHFIAHSRGTDVLASILQQLGIETYAARTTISERLKVKNIVFVAPDIDLDVASSKLIVGASDPDMLYGSRKNPHGSFPQGDIHVTIYSSPNDRALGIASYLFGSVLRLGSINIETSGRDYKKEALPQFAGIVDFIEFEQRNSLVGHDYFLTSPDASADLVALIRYGLKVGDPQRPLAEVKRPFWRIVQRSAN